MEVLTNASVEHTAIGRIVVPPNVPRGFRVFYTTINFDGRIDDRIRDFVKPASLSSCHQVHGDRVGAAFRPPGGLKPAATPEPTCDALWSDQRNSALAIKVADCLPVSIIDTRGVIANIHSGWRGAVQQITAKTLDAAPINPPTSVAFLGPTIRVCCFEVGENVAERIRTAYADAEEFIDRSRAKPHVDLAGLTAMLLRRRGMSADRIHDSTFCTRCDGSIFHSYRRQGPRGGRNLAVVAQS